MRKLLIIVVLGGLLGGCLTPNGITLTRYYTLSPELAVEKAKPTSYTLGIRPLLSANHLTKQMAYLENGFLLKYRIKEEWAEMPARVVGRAIEDALFATGRFADVGNASDLARPDYLLTGELRVFQENWTQTPPTAEIELRLELREARGEYAPWAATLAVSESMADKSAKAAAAAMNTALRKIAAQAATQIAQASLQH